MLTYCCWIWGLITAGLAVVLQVCEYCSIDVWLIGCCAGDVNNGERMMKIYIVGIVAGGKTTLAKELSRRLATPWYELDCIVHVNSDKGRYKRTPEEQVELINSIDKAGRWIIEGTYRKSCHCLMDMADTIIFLDPPLGIRKLRIIKRFIKQQLGLEKCHYKSDIGMLKLMFKWTREFESDRRNFEGLLQPYNNKVLRLQDNKDLSFLRGINRQV